MGVETKTIKGRQYHYLRHYYRLEGKKKYKEAYLGREIPGPERLEELKQELRRQAEEDKLRASRPEEELPVYLL